MNPQAYAQAYINRLFQTLSTTLGPHLSGRAARKKNLPLLPELSTPCNHANDVQIPALTWKLLPCQNLLPCNETTPCPRVRFPQTSLDLHSVLHAKGAVNALQRYSAQPNAHSTGVLVYYINKKTGISKITYDWYKQKIYDWCINENP